MHTGTKSGLRLCCISLGHQKPSKLGHLSGHFPISWSSKYNESCFVHIQLCFSNMLQMKTEFPFDPVCLRNRLQCTFSFSSDHHFHTFHGVNFAQDFQDKSGYFRTRRSKLQSWGLSGRVGGLQNPYNGWQSANNGHLLWDSKSYISNTSSIMVNLFGGRYLSRRS